MWERAPYLQELLLRLRRDGTADFLVLSPQDGPLRAELEAAGIGVHDMTAADLEKWRAVAQDSAWKDFAARSETCAGLLKMAQSVTA